MSKLPEEKAREIEKRNKRLEIAKNIAVNKANLLYIAESGSINGSLMLGIEKALADYADEELKAYREALKECIQGYEDARFYFESQTDIEQHEAFQEAIIKAKQLIEEK